MAAQSVDDLDRLIVTAEHLEAGLLAAQQRIVGLLGQLGRLAADLVEVRQSIAVALLDAAPTRLDEPAAGGVVPAGEVRLRPLDVTIVGPSAVDVEDVARRVSAAARKVGERSRRAPEVVVPIPAAPPVEIPPAALANTCAREGCAHPKRLHTDEGCIDSCGCFAYVAPPKP